MRRLRDDHGSSMQRTERAVVRVEDASLLTARGRFADDMGERPGTAHGAVLRSPHVHADIVSVDVSAALAMPEIVAVLTGEDAAAWTRPFIAGVEQPMRHYALAVDRVRYVGEPVSVVIGRDRYAAEDALERIDLEYRELGSVIEPKVATARDMPLLHPEVGSNVVSERRFGYGDSVSAFANAEHRVDIEVRYPRNACTPIEGFVVVAEYLGDDGYDVLSNFQGPFSLHPVMARALGIPRLAPPPAQPPETPEAASASSRPSSPTSWLDVPRLAQSGMPGQVGGGSS